MITGNARAVIDQLRQARDGLPSAIEEQLEHVAEVAVDEVRSDWPIDTGLSSSAFRVVGTEVVNDVPYVEFVRDAEGRIDRAAQRAADRTAPEVDAAITDYLVRSTA